MVRLKRLRPSPPMLVAVVALVGALAGTAVADHTTSTSALSKKKAKKIATKQIKKLAPDLSVASAEVAANAQALQGQGPNAFAPAAVEAPRRVGTAGNPGFVSGWSNEGGTFQTARFWKDPWGVVHLEGAIQRTSGISADVFFLPPGYRPSRQLNLPAYGDGSTFASFAVDVNGAVRRVAGDVDFMSLSGITFRAG